MIRLHGKPSAMKLNKVNYTNNIKDFTKKAKRAKGDIKWESIPKNIQKRIEEAWELMGLKDKFGLVDNKVFYVEVHTPTTIYNNAGLAIHANSWAYEDVKMTLLYYYDINGITSELEFFKRKPRKAILGKIMNFFNPLYNKFNSIKLNEHNVVFLNEKILHRPKTSITNSEKSRRNVLSIYVCLDS